MYLRVEDKKSRTCRFIIYIQIHNYNDTLLIFIFVKLFYSWCYMAINFRPSFLSHIKYFMVSVDNTQSHICKTLESGKIMIEYTGVVSVTGKAFSILKVIFSIKFVLC